MVDASEDQGDVKNGKGKEPERDEGDTTVEEEEEEEETVDESDADGEDDDDDGEEDEPKLKYARLTAHLLPVYRNGDATSAFLVAGDKMVSLDEEPRLRASTKPSTVCRHT